MKILPVLGLLLAVTAGPSWAEDPRTINVTGRGEVSLAPDQATVTVGVTTTAKRANDALDGNSRLMAAVMAAIMAEGIEARDVQTTNLSLQPQWNRQGNVTVVTGYSATNMVAILVRDLPKLGAVLDRLASAGANNINSIAFGVEDSSAAQDEARRRAVGDARAKAELYADAAGVALDKLLILNEGFISTPQPMSRARDMVMAEASVPVAEGQLTVTAQVNMTYAIAE